MFQINNPLIFATRLRACLFITLFLIPSPLCLAQEESLLYPGVIHIHSSISDGQTGNPLRKLAILAKDQEIKILAFSDTFLRRFEFGLPIFSNIFKVSMENPSVVKYGIKNYLQDLKKVKEEFPDMVILEGVEVMPFYWWKGGLFKKNLLLNDCSRHLLVIGLKGYQDYAYLPVISNRYFFPRLKDIPSLLIVLSLIISGILLLKKTKQRKSLGVILNIAGVLFLLNIFPFSASRFNAYHGDKGFRPYQDLINYVRKKGGLVFWAHPEIIESTSSGKFVNINFYTPSYPESLFLTSGYTGFGVDMSPGASHRLILAGREWDSVLASYCEGKRNEPVWVIGETDYHGGGKIGMIQNIFFLPEFNQEALYYALGKGRFYIRYYAKNRIDISLRDFHIEDSKTSGRFAFFGEETKIGGSPRLVIKGNYLINPPEDLKIEVIRNGKVIQEFKFSNEGVFDLEFQDDSLQALRRRNYYRLNFFTGDKVILVTNPIFFEIKNG